MYYTVKYPNTAIHYVWITLLIPGDGERIAGRLVSRGFNVQPFSSTGKIEHASTGCLGSLASFKIESTFKPKPNEPEKAFATQMSSAVVEVLAELGILYHSIIVLSCEYGGNMWYSWYASNIEASQPTVESESKASEA